MGRKRHKSPGKFDDKQNYRDIIEAAMVSTNADFTENIIYVTVKNPSASKPLRQFTQVFDFKQKITVHRFGDAKSYIKAIIVDRWFSNPKRHGLQK